jgi:hypothetical protein
VSSLHNVDLLKKFHFNGGNSILLHTLGKHDSMCKDYVPSAKHKRTSVSHGHNGLLQLDSKKDARAGEKESFGMEHSIINVFGLVWTNRVGRTRDDLFI